MTVDLRGLEISGERNSLVKKPWRALEIKESTKKKE